MVCCKVRKKLFREPHEDEINCDQEVKKKKSSQLTPPHPNARARSFPVPRGRTPTAGGGWKPIWSSTDKTQPTVPSPPHARTRKFGTLRNNSKLWKWKKKERKSRGKINTWHKSSDSEKDCRQVTRVLLPNNHTCLKARGVLSLTPFSVPLVSSQRLDVDSKATGIFARVSRLDCLHSSDLWTRGLEWRLVLESVWSQKSWAPSPSTSSFPPASFLVFSLAMT